MRMVRSAFSTRGNFWGHSWGVGMFYIYYAPGKFLVRNRSVSFVDAPICAFFGAAQPAALRQTTSPLMLQ
jgi:hypothetical protein